MSDRVYSGYPITVETVCHEAPGATSRGGIVAKDGAVNPRIRRVLKAAAVAAAVLLLAVLFHSTHSSSGTTMAKVVRAFGQAENVRVVSLSPRTGEVIYEIWVSRELNFTGMVTPLGCVVYDLARGEKEDVLSGAVVPAEDLELNNVRQMGDHCLQFSLAGVPSDATWKRLDDNGNWQMHEFTWIRKTSDGRPIPTRYEVAIDKSTMLPMRFRLFRMDSAEAGWEWKSQIVFEYPTETRMKSVMAGESLRPSSDLR